MEIINMNEWLQKNKSKGIDFDTNFENLSETEARLLLKSVTELAFKLVKNIETLTNTQVDMIKRINELSENQTTLIEYMESSGTLLKTLHAYKETMLEAQDIQTKRIDLIMKHLGV